MIPWIEQELQTTSLNRVFWVGFSTQCNAIQGKREDMESFSLDIMSIIRECHASIGIVSRTCVRGTRTTTTTVQREKSCMTNYYSVSQSCSVSDSTLGFPKQNYSPTHSLSFSAPCLPRWKIKIALASKQEGHETSASPPQKLLLISSQRNRVRRIRARIREEATPDTKEHPFSVRTCL